MGKKWYASKVFWVNILGMIFLVVQSVTGKVIDIQYQALALTIINLILRLVTREEIIW